MADLARAHLLVEHLQGFFQWREMVLGQVLVAQLAEEVGAAFRPVQLVEVDAIGLQAPQALFQCRDDVLPVVPELTVADMADAIAGAGHLAGQYPVVPIALAGEPVTDDALGSGIGFRPRGYRIHLGGIDEVDARGLGPGNLFECLGLIVLLAPGHGAQTQRADLEVGATQLTVVHRLLAPWLWSFIKAG